MAENTDYLLKCIECGDDFFTEGERNFYKSKGLNMPKRCKVCRDKKKARYEQIQKENERAEQEALLLTLPFKQIKKEEISLINPNTSLFIIGNGFDLMHGVPSSYYNFRDSMGRHNELRNALEMYIKKEDLWADFEESLAQLDDEAMLGTVNDWMDIFDAKDQFDDDFSAA
ncbi:MAG: AbiH family protein, partial [Lutispora sp.]|nr:AbiH family protein [Lutispora sp.]